MQTEFDLDSFLPYLLNQAAEATSRSFHSVYKAAYGLTRTQWRVLANLGKFGSMTARDICEISHTEKTKVSRAVSALQRAGLLARQTSEQDRRVEILSLTESGYELFVDLGQRAIAHDKALRARIDIENVSDLDSLLRRIIALDGIDAVQEAFVQASRKMRG